MKIEDFHTKIDVICKQFCKTNNNPRIEFDDLRQEAYVKCLELIKPGDKGEAYIFTSIRNHLINYIKKNTIKQEIAVGLNPQEFL